MNAKIRQSRPRLLGSMLLGALLLVLLAPLLFAERPARTQTAQQSPRDVGREFINMFTVFDENSSPYLVENIERFAPESVPGDDDFVESNLMHSINGYVYGNMPMMEMKKDRRVRWYLMGMGTEVDLHTPHWHGQTVTIMGMRTDVAELLPASMKVADMKPDNPGTWLYHCHVNDHIDAGMIARFKVNP